MPDTSGNANNGTASGNPNWVSGLIGNCLEFDGINDSVEKLSAVSLPTSTMSPWSINAYLYVDQQPTSAVAGFGTADRNQKQVR